MSRSYFNKLNYTLANEDTEMELGIIPENISHLMSVAGSGGRVLPLLAKNPSHVTCVDLSQEQLYLTELRFESVRALKHSEFLAFWGYPPSPAESKKRKELFYRIQLSNDARVFFEDLFEEHQWESILYLGKWEQTFARLSQVNRKITGVRGIGLFTAMTRAEHERYMKTRFPTYAWALTLSLLGHASVFNSLLYKGHFPKKNLPESSFKYYSQTFDKLFAQGPVRKNFFLQLLFFGKILFSDGNPIECDLKVFKKAKLALEKCQIRYVLGNIVELAGSADIPIDVLSISDVPSYFSGETEKNFMQTIRKGLNPGGLVVIRNYMRVPEGTDYSGFDRVTEDYTPWIQKEKVQMYQVDVFRKESHQAH